jgi:hypothetical protein
MNLEEVESDEEPHEE